MRCACRPSRVGRESVAFARPGPWIFRSITTRARSSNEPAGIFADQPVDVNVIAAAKRRKKLLVADMDFDDHQCRMSRRASRPWRGLKGAGLGDHRARHARRTRFSPTRCAKRVAMLKGLETRSAGARPQRAHPPQSPAPRPCWRPCGRMARIRCWCRAASAIFTSPRRAERRVPRRPGQHIAGRRRGADRPCRRSHPRPRGENSPRSRKPRPIFGIDIAEVLAVGDGANDLAMIPARRPSASPITPNPWLRRPPGA